MAIEALIFDVFGTVVDWRRGVSEAVARALPGRCDPDAFADAWRARYQPAMARVRSGARPFAKLDILHAENLDATLAEFGLADALDAQARADLNRAWERLPAWPDSATGVAALRRRFIVAPCSNGSIAMMTRLARFAGLSWDCILGAEVARAYKPDPRAYLGSAEALDLSPDQVMMVAAHEDDLAAARAAGLATAFVPRPFEHGPEGRYATSQAGWDATARDIDHLAELAAGW